VTVAELVEDLQRDETLDRIVLQIADVVVLGDAATTSRRSPRPSASG
jgi:hypothetical protein